MRPRRVSQFPCMSCFEIEGNISKMRYHNGSRVATYPLYNTAVLPPHCFFKFPSVIIFLLIWCGYVHFTKPLLLIVYGFNLLVREFLVEFACFFAKVRVMDFFSHFFLRYSDFECLPCIGIEIFRANVGFKIETFAKQETGSN